MGTLKRMSAAFAIVPRRWFTRIALALVVVMALLVLARRPLTAAALATTLRLAGAGEVQLSVTRASPWQVEIENLGFKVRSQRFDAKRVTFDRAHWWSPSLAAVRVAGVSVPLVVDGSDTNPWQWTTYSGKEPTINAQNLQIPADEVSVDGTLTVQAAGQRDETVTVKFAARRTTRTKWSGTVETTAQGFVLRIEGDYDHSKHAVHWRVPQAELNLDHWQGFISRVVVLPGGKWELAGQLTGTAQGAYADGKLMLAGEVKLRDGRFGFPARGFEAQGVTADFKFTDLDKFISEPGKVHVAEMRAGEIHAANVDLEMAFDTVERVAVQHASLEAFGGRLAAEPFKIFPRLNEFEATLLVDNVAVEELLALAKDTPAKASGRMDGRLPIRVDGNGLRLGTGWLELRRGVYAEVQFNASGLLTRGVSTASPQYVVLRKIEAGLLRLRLSQLRLDVRPPNVPLGRSAIVHVSGEPTDPEVKAPVTLDLNVNGPIESLLNLGFDNRVRFDAK